MTPALKARQEAAVAFGVLLLALGLLQQGEVSGAAEVLGETPAVNMRVGGSDSRWYRMFDVPTVVLGLTPPEMAQLAMSARAASSRARLRANSA